MEGALVVIMDLVATWVLMAVQAVLLETHNKSTLLLQEQKEDGIHTQHRQTRLNHGLLLKTLGVVDILLHSELSHLLYQQM